MTTAHMEWQRFDYEHGETIWQRECPDCDRGLLLAPARFCGRCHGSGYLTTTVDPMDPAATSFGMGHSSHAALLESKVAVCPKCGRRHG